MADILSTIGALGSLVGALVFFVALLSVPFLRGRRKEALKVSGIGFAATVLCGFLVSSPEDREAREAGFRSASDMAEAAEAGISDAAEWEVRRLALLEQKEREAAERKAAEQAAKEAAARAKEEAKAQAEAEERRQGFHCLSPWDGAHSAFKQFVQSQMRNPKSFEHIETRITPVNPNGEHTAIMKYRAENGFGGMNIGFAKATVSNATCDFDLIILE